MSNDPRPRKNLAFVDVETTGLDPYYHEIIEVAVLLTDPTGEKILEEYEAKLRPTFIKRAHSEALKVNGYTPEEWSHDKCTQSVVVASHLATMLDGVQIVGQNPSFDTDFITLLFTDHMLEPDWDYHRIDIASMAWPLFTNGKIEKLRLEKVAEQLGVLKGEQAHRAMADVRLAREVYLALQKLYAPLFTK